MYIYAKKKNTISKQRKPKTLASGPWTCHLTCLLCFLTVIKTSPAAGPYKGLGLPASLPSSQPLILQLAYLLSLKKHFIPAGCIVPFSRPLNDLPFASPGVKKWQPTPVFLPGKFHGQRNLVGYRAWGCKVRHYWATEHTHSQIITCWFEDR